VQLGIGIGNFTESGGLSPSKISAAVGLGGAGWEAATVRMLPSGRVEVITGTSPHGQGHATSWSQIAADALGVHPDEVEVHHGDTAIAPWGRDTYGSRSLSVGGVAVHLACGKVADKAQKIAAHMLEAAEADVEFSGGRFSVAGSQDPALTIQEVAGAAFAAADLPEGMEPGLTADYFFDPPNFTWPFGTHICVTEVDTETGGVTIPKYVAVDDCGPVVNPQVVEGQLHGGIAQGIAQALYEEATYDESGTLTSASMMDYMIPGAPEIPHMILDSTVTPSSTSLLGVTHVDMPASPMRIWEAIQKVQKE
jgi:carbon-monoxide dehydrogenase large subunit